jgi:hypothetical protein
MDRERGTVRSACRGRDALEMEQHGQREVRCGQPVGEGRHWGWSSMDRERHCEVSL